MTDTTKKPQGFATLSPERQRAIASKGGKAAHEKGTAHQFDPREAKEAGRKGGAAVSADRAHMAEIGRKGGRARGEKARAAASASQARTAVNPHFPAKIEMPPGGEEPLY
jgi:general stress protein YciG